MGDFAHFFDRKRRSFRNFRQKFARRIFFGNGIQARTSPSFLSPADIARVNRAFPKRFVCVPVPAIRADGAKIPAAEIAGVSSRRSRNRKDQDDNQNKPSIRAVPINQFVFQNGALTHDLQTLAFFVPNAVGIGGDDVKRIFSGGQKRKINFAARADIRPILFQTFDPVTKFDLFGFDKTDARITNFEIIFICLKRNSVFDKRGVRAVNQNIFDLHATAVTGLNETSFGSTIATPSCVGNQNFPSAAFIPAGCRPPLHSVLSIPSCLP